ncbi:MAG: ribokinase [Bacteroidetes bacterium]|nr:ribokinase [Bacteroidota bacterium]
MIEQDTRKKILVIGSSNTDMVVTADKLPSAGQTLLGNGFFMNAGGKGANQAVAAARLGAAVSMVFRIGNDVFGQKAVETLAKEGIDTRHVFTDDQLPSGVALITVDARGENQIVVAPGANGNLLPADLQQIEQTILSADVILMQLEIPMQTVVAAADMAYRMGKQIILNPAPALPIPADLLRRISVLTPNESEASLISGVSITDGESARAAAKKIAASGVPHVIVTRGSQGALILSNNRFEEVAAPSVDVVDTTAAGDVFNGALAVALAEGSDLLASARWGVAAAALSVTRKGAQSSAPYRQEIVGRMKKFLIL